MKFRLWFLAMGILFSGCASKRLWYGMASETLMVEQISANVWQHISYLQTEEFGNVACNGMIVRSGSEVVIFDTPTNDGASKELISWVEDELQCKVVGVVATHFHEDCLGGLAPFHTKEIPSYANTETIRLAKMKGYEVPQNGIDQHFDLQFGTKSVTLEFLGEGHTKDNIVAYFPKEKVLFGGCLIKCIDASKGFLGDANIEAWSSTIEKVQNRFPKVEIVIPGHGDRGGPELLEYTKNLFKPEN